MKYKVIIIDDEKVARENLQMMLRNISSELVLFEAKNIIDAKNIIEKEPIDVIFLDINMPQHNGFELLDIIDGEKFIVVVVTAHLNHSIKAIKVKAFDFLLKPFGFSTLKDTLQRIEKELSKNKTIEINSKKIAFKTKNEIFYVDPNEIIYFESDNNYTTVFFSNNKKVMLSRSIKSIEEELLYPFLFRVHRSYIINLNYISKYNITDGMVYLQNDTIIIPISDRKKKDFSSLIKN